MSKKNIKNINRRKLLKSAAITSGVVGASGLMVDKWVKPIVSAVVLPAHAQTTDALRFLHISDDIFEVVLNGNQINGQIIAQKAKDILIASANAQLAADRYVIYLEKIAGDLYKFTYTLEVDNTNRTFFHYGTKELRVGVEETFSYERCDSLGPRSDVTAAVKIESVDSEEAKILVAPFHDSFSEADSEDIATVTAKFDPNAVEPMSRQCPFLT